MKKLLITLIILTGLTATSQNQETHQLNTEQSVINWQGSYSFSFSEHTGTVHFKEGELITLGGNITGGSFVIDMTTISNEAYLRQEGAVKHLRGDDFFDVEKFPDAKLVLTSVEYFTNENTHRIFAYLTIKGITKNIRFYATADGDAKTLEAKFKIDRTRWGITYNHKLKDEAISDAMEFIINLQFQTDIK
jgi:polyisoprenoid-binding protein YceI